jgi:hypothetical protein
VYVYVYVYLYMYVYSYVRMCTCNLISAALGASQSVNSVYQHLARGHVECMNVYVQFVFHYMWLVCMCEHCT